MVGFKLEHILFESLLIEPTFLSPLPTNARRVCFVVELSNLQHVVDMGRLRAGWRHLRRYLLSNKRFEIVHINSNF